MAVISQQLFLLSLYALLLTSFSSNDTDFSIATNETEDYFETIANQTYPIGKRLEKTINVHKLAPTTITSSNTPYIIQSKRSVDEQNVHDNNDQTEITKRKNNEGTNKSEEISSPQESPEQNVLSLGKKKVILEVSNFTFSPSSTGTTSNISYISQPKGSIEEPNVSFQNNKTLNSIKFEKTIETKNIDAGTMKTEKSSNTQKSLEQNNTSPENESYMLPENVLNYRIAREVENESTEEPQSNDTNSTPITPEVTKPGNTSTIATSSLITKAPTSTSATKSVKSIFKFFKFSNLISVVGVVGVLGWAFYILNSVY